MNEGSYSAEAVITYLTQHGHLRAKDLRVMRLNGRHLAETYRNTLATWLERGDRRIPLGRFDEVLVSVGSSSREFEDWEEEHFGFTSYVDPPGFDDALDLQAAYEQQEWADG